VTHGKASHFKMHKTNFKAVYDKEKQEEVPAE